METNMTLITWIYFYLFIYMERKKHLLYSEKKTTICSFKFYLVEGLKY